MRCLILLVITSPILINDPVRPIIEIGSIAEMSEIIILEMEVEVEENQLNYLVVEKANEQLRHASCVAYSPMVKNAQFE
jgi:hypothetical protein